MFARHYFGAAFYGPRYFGDGGNNPPDPVVSTGAGDYGESKKRKRKFIVKKDGQLLVFHDEQTALAALEEDEPEAVETQEMAQESTPTEKQEVIAAQPNMSIELDRIKQAAIEHEHREQYQRLLRKERYEELVALYERLMDEEEDDFLLMSA